MPYLGHILMKRHYPTAIHAQVALRDFATYCDYLVGKRVRDFAPPAPAERFAREEELANRHMARTRSEWRRGKPETM